MTIVSVLFACTAFALSFNDYVIPGNIVVIRLKKKMVMVVNGVG